jgi:hypothetical protein
MTNTATQTVNNNAFNLAQKLTNEEFFFSDVKVNFELINPDLVLVEVFFPFKDDLGSEKYSPETMGQIKNQFAKERREKLKDIFDDTHFLYHSTFWDHAGASLIYCRHSRGHNVLKDMIKVRVRFQHSNFSQKPGKLAPDRFIEDVAC